MILKQVILWSLVTVYASISETYGTNINYYIRGSIWPTPQQQARKNNYYSLDAEKFNFNVHGEISDVLTEALVRYKHLTFPDGPLKVDKDLETMTSLLVVVAEPYKPLDLMTDESYTLVIAAPVSKLTAKTVWGALRGLESFSQLVHVTSTGYYYAEQNEIVDFPRFHHRGFLIDTARHYINKTIILQFLDALSYSKFNVLHWHIVDNEAFPFVSKVYPALHEQGARDSKRSIYTPEDVQEIIEFGRLRGIRVLPEFNTPGHTQSWFSIKNLLTPCYTSGKPNGRYGPINPTLDSTYTFLKAFFTEVANVFPDPYLHLGGDDFSFSCWRSNPDIAKWMQTNGMGKDFSILRRYYEQRLLDIVSSLGKKSVIWQEVVDKEVKVATDTVVNVWKGGWKSEMARISKFGFRTILSSCWKLNYISYGSDLEEYYKCDPHDFHGTQEQKDSVIGGTALMYGEWVDGTNLISRSWARGMSVGGRLWSSKTTTDIIDAYQRIWEHRCRYLERGIRASPIAPSQYCRHEWSGK